MNEYGWTVVGAGPAGIAAVGKLLDHGVPPGSIAWVDPEFAAGDLGAKWRAVPSNTSVKLFINYLTGADSFRFAHAPHFALNDRAPSDTCLLGDVADPLVWITGQLCTQVSALRTTATGLSLQGGRWTVQTELGEIASKNVILAVGSTPKTLDYPWLNEIPIDVALNPAKLAEQPLEGATVAVFGSSHSSMIALPNLLAGPAAKVINFYRGPLRYAVDMGDWTLFDDMGLKGAAARWARENVDGVPPARLQRCLVDGPEFPELLQSCDYAVYTVGFSPRAIPATPQWGRLECNAANGIIAPGLFGLGIAFPEYRIDPMGFGEYRVGLQKFMDRLNKALPLWMKYGS